MLKPTFRPLDGKSKSYGQIKKDSFFNMENDTDHEPTQVESMRPKLFVVRHL